MTNLPIDDSILEDWLCGPVPEEKLKESDYEIFDFLLLQE
jgi:hypothetical protein